MIISVEMNRKPNPIQYNSQEQGRLWRFLTCEELVGVTHRRRKKKD